MLEYKLKQSGMIAVATKNVKFEMYLCMYTF